MKAITVIQPGDMRLLETEIPTLDSPDSVLVKIIATGICGSDVHVAHGTNPYASYPRVPGHEGAGVVVAVGKNVTDLKEGDSVVLEPITYCGKCYACRNGRHNVCRDLSVLGCSVDGTFREFGVFPRSQVYPFDSTKMSYVQAAMCEPYTIGFQAAARADIRKNDTVLIFGAGPIGLILCDVAKYYGATVIVSEPQESRRKTAGEFGADVLINPADTDLADYIQNYTGGEGVNVIFEAAGVPALIQQAVYLLSPGGRFVPMTFGSEPQPINFKEVNAKELTILGSRHQYQKFPSVIEFLPSRLDRVNALVTHTFPIEEYAQGFSTFADKHANANKVVLTF